MPAPQVLESRQERWEQLPGPVLGPSPPPAQTQRREAQGSVSPFVNSRLRGLLDQLPGCGKKACSLMGSALQAPPRFLARV